MTDQTQQALIDALDRYLRQDEFANDTDNGVYRQGMAAMSAALSHAAPAVGAPVADDEGPACPNCEGTGAVVVLSDNGPDAYNVEECCPHCEGAGGLLEAYNGLYKLLNAEEKAKWSAMLAAATLSAPKADEEKP
jgi:hypothetical protein